MIFYRLTKHIKHYPYPKDITLKQTLETKGSPPGKRLFLAGLCCQGNSFSLYLYIARGEPFFYIFRDNDESDHNDQSIILPGTIDQYEIALNWIRSAAGQNHEY